MYLQTDKINQCYGCGMCDHICPTQSIKMIEDEEGFRYPQIDADTCIHCNKCVKVCPHSMQPVPAKLGPLYALRHKDKVVLSQSQSGGAFSALAENILDSEGVVYGCVLDDKFRAIHVRAENKAELPPMHGSKYVQSIITHEVYQNLSNDVRSGRPVLFVGTPCQAAAVQKAYGRYGNLLTVDFLCHGVPSPKIWQFFLGGKSMPKRLKTAKKIMFRHVCPEIAGNHAEAVVDKNGTVYLTNDYSAIFYTHLAHRPSCYQCQFASPNRYSDITIGGFLDTEYLSKPYKDGVSMVFVNTDKGMIAFNKAKENAETEIIEGANLHFHNQPCLYQPVKQPINRTLFWADVQNKPFEYVIKKYATNEIKKKYRLNIPQNDIIMDEVKEKFQAFVENDLKNNGGLIVNQMNEVRTMLTYPKFTEPFRMNYLNSLLSYAARNIPFWKPYFKDGKEELKDFPVIDKGVVRDNFEDIFAPEFRISALNHEKFTSGSTGTPFRVLWNHKKHMRLIADMKFYQSLAGVESHERIVCMHAQRKMSKKTMADQERDNLFNIYYFMLDDDTIGKILDEALSYRPKLIIAYGTMWDAFANYIYEGKAPACKFELTAMLSEADHLKKRTRDILEEYFGCPIYSRYGDEECGVLGQEDSTGQGHLMNTASYYFEILKMNSDEPAAPGEVGRIVLTDLFNYATPLIRYYTGDLGSIKTTEDGKQYLVDFVGRITDALYTTSGKRINQHHVVWFSGFFPDIKRVQFIQEGQKDYRIKLVTENHTYENQMIEEFKKYFGEDGNFVIEYVDDIPLLPSGKFQLTVNKFKQV